MNKVLRNVSKNSGVENYNFSINPMFFINVMKYLFMFCAFILCVKINISEAASDFEIISEKPQEKKFKTMTYDDFEHPNMGCPENSLCEKEMGLHRKKWLTLLRDIRDKSLPEKIKVKRLEEFRRKHGIPVGFLAQKTQEKDLWKILWSSECRWHRTEKLEDKVFYGNAFVSELSKDVAFVRYGEKVSKVTVDENFQLDPITVYSGKKTYHYYAPKGEIPLYLQKGKLVFLRDDEEVFYGLEIAPSGKWKITSSENKNQSRFFAGSEDTKCPEEVKPLKPFYQSHFCRKIYNIDTKKFDIIQYSWSC